MQYSIQGCSRVLTKLLSCTLSIVILDSEALAPQAQTSNFMQITSLYMIADCSTPRVLYQSTLYCATKMLKILSGYSCHLAKTWISNRFYHGQNALFGQPTIKSKYPSCVNTSQKREAILCCWFSCCQSALNFPFLQFSVQTTCMRRHGL